MEMDLNSILKVGKEKGLEYLELYKLEVNKCTWKIYEAELEKYNMSSEIGISLKGSYNGKIGYAYTEKIDSASIDVAIDMVMQYAMNSTEEYFKESNDFIPNVFKKEIDNIEELSPDYIKELLLKLEKNALEYDKRISSVSEMEFIHLDKKITLIDSLGMDIVDSFSNNILAIGIIAKDDVDTKTLFSFDKINHISYEAMLPYVEKICNDTIELLGASKVKTNNYKVIIQNNAFAEIIASMVPAFTAMNVLRKISRLKDKLNTVIAKPILNLVDNPLDENGFINRLYDDEGSKTQKTYFIKEGKLLSYLQNKKTSRIMNMQNTSNGYKLSHKQTVGIMPTNIMIEPGKIKFKDLINEVNDGLLITDVQGLHAGVNPVSGDISLSCSGFVIQNGEKTKPFSNSIVSGNFYKIIEELINISDDIYYTFNGDFCLASPSILVDNLTIAGE